MINLDLVTFGICVLGLAISLWAQNIPSSCWAFLAAFCMARILWARKE